MQDIVAAGMRNAGASLAGRADSKAPPDRVRTVLSSRQLARQPWFLVDSFTGGDQPAIRGDDFLTGANEFTCDGLTN